MGELGSLRVSLKSSGEETADEVKSSSIKDAKVNFRPGNESKDVLNNLTYTKV